MRAWVVTSLSVESSSHGDRTDAREHIRKAIGSCRRLEARFGPYFRRGCVSSTSTHMPGLQTRVRLQGVAAPPRSRCEPPAPRVPRANGQRYAPAWGIPPASGNAGERSAQWRAPRPKANPAGYCPDRPCPAGQRDGHLPMLPLRRDRPPSSTGELAQQLLPPLPMMPGDPSAPLALAALLISSISPAGRAFFYQRPSKRGG